MKRKASDKYALNWSKRRVNINYLNFENGKEKTVFPETKKSKNIQLCNCTV